MSTPLRFSLLLIVFLSACAPASTPVPTSAPVDSMASPADIVEKFYKTINDAQTKDDLLSAFTLITNEAVCSPKIAPNCDTSKFQEKWWQVKVVYKLYACGEDVVIAEESRYPRDPSAPSTPIAPRFSRFTVAQTEDGLLIAEISPTQALEDGCVLAIESEN